MRKEIIIAIIAGVLIGLLVAFGSWRANLAMKAGTDADGNAQPETAVNVQSTENIHAINSSGPQINLTNVENYDVITESPLNLIGITKPNSVIAISGENEDHVIKARPDGSFDQKMGLIEGVNQIIITAYSPQGEKVEEKFIVVYSMNFNKDAS